ncbi:MAG: sugar transferase [Acidimicrobiia bacterium]|nr:sugar transferase [Acidimicrobiia bacterium]
MSGRERHRLADAARRLLDVAVGAFMLLASSPILLGAAAAVRFSSRGPIFYGAPRSGRDGGEFRMWKFRTMVTDAAAVGGPITAPDDPRVTRVGAILRKTKLDEIPQFYNVIIGDMSLVGPRPEDPGIVERYTPRQRETLRVRPGVTSPGSLFYEREQVHTIPEGASAEEYYLAHLLGPKLEVDLAYLEKRTLGSDLGVMAETAGHMFRSLVGRPRT